MVEDTEIIITSQQVYNLVEEIQHVLKLKST